MSISEANSIPPDLRFNLFRASFLMARSPQWASEMWHEKRVFKIQVRIGFPI
jgi:hypothetical protein